MPTSLPGVYGVTVSLANGARSQMTFVADDDAFVVSGSADDLERVPELTGGVAAASSDLSPLVRSSSGDPAAITSRGCASDAIGVVDGRVRCRTLRRMDAAAAPRIEVTT